MEFLKAMKVRLKELQSGSTPSKGKWSTVGSVERKALTIALKGGLLVVGKEVGSGGQGHVFAATHAGKQYALKQSSFAEGSRQERIAQADLEFGTSLQHECLQEYLAWTIQEAGVHPKGKKLLMLKTVQLLAETDLHDALDKGAFHNSDGLPKLGKLLTVFHEVARGVAYLHGQRVVHCDLKHSNVLITGCDTATPAARVCDFGLCVRLQNKEQEWCLGKHGRGTHGYIAPEIYPGVVMKDGRCMSLIALRSDVYSMGIMLWEALTLCAAASHSQSVSREAPRVAPLVHPNFPRLTCFGPLEQFLVAQHGSEILLSLEKLISHMCHSDWQQRPDALSVVASMATLIGQVEKTSSAPTGKGQLSGSHSLSGALVPRRGLLGGKHKQKAGDSHKLQPEVKKQGTDKHKSSKKSSKKKKGYNPPPADSANTAPESSTSHPASSTATSAGIQAVHAGATSAGIQAVHTTATSAAPNPNQTASVYNSPQIPTKILPTSSVTGAAYSSQSPAYEPPPLLPPLSRPAEPCTHTSISAAVGASLSGGNPAVPDWRAGNSTTSTGSTTRTPLLKAVHDQLEEAMSSLTSFRRSPQAAAALNTSPAAPSSGVNKPISGSISSNNLAGDSGLVSRSSSSYTAAASKMSYEPLSVLASAGNGAAGGGGSGSKSGRLRPGGILARWQQMMEERGILPAESDSSQPSTGVNSGTGATSQLHTADMDDNMAPTASRPPRQDASMPDSSGPGSGADGPSDSQHGAVLGDGPIVSRFGLSSRVLDAMSGAVGKPPMHPPPTGIGALREGSLTASVTELLRSSQESLSAMNAVSRRLAEREASLGVQQESSVEHPARMGSGLLSRNSGLSLRRSSSTFELQPAANGGSHQRLLSTGGSQFLSIDRPLLSDQIRWDSPSPTAHGAGMSTCSSMFDLDGVVGCTFDQSNGPPTADSVNISDSHFTMQSSVLYSLREARSEPTILSPRHKRPANTLSAGPSHTNTAYALITRPESLDLPCPPLPDLDSDFETTSFHSDFELSNASISDIRPALLYQPPFSPVAEVLAPTGPNGHPSGAASSSSSGPQGSMSEAPNQMLLSQISNPEFTDTAISTLDFDASVAFGPTGDNLVAPTGHALQDRKHSTGQAASYSGMNCDTGTHRYSMHDSDSDTAISISFHTARVQPEAPSTDHAKEHDLLLSSFRALRLKEDSTCSISSPPAKVALSSFQNSVAGTSDGAIIPSSHQNGSASLPGAILASSQSLSG